MKRILINALVVVLSCGIAGCNYGAAVIQNLGWGLSGMFQSILVNVDLSGGAPWIIGALANGLLYGHQ